MKITIKLPDIKAMNEKLKSQIQAGLDNAITSEVTVLKTRLLSGQDIDGQAVKSYAPYTEKYAKKRQSKGRPINKVDWSFTGDFNRSIDYETKTIGSKFIALIFPRGKEEILESLVKKRPRHWGLTERAIERIKKTIQGFIKL